MRQYPSIAKTMNGKAPYIIPQPRQNIFFENILAKRSGRRKRRGVRLCRMPAKRVLPRRKRRVRIVPLQYDSTTVYDGITIVSRLCRDLFTEEMRCVICNAAAAAARGAAVLPRPRARRMRERAAAVPFCGRLKTSFPRNAAAARGAVCARHAAACAAEYRARTGSAPARA